MNKVVLIALLAGAAALAWFLFGSDDDGTEWNPQDDPIYGTEEQVDPTLLGADGAGPRQPKSAKVVTKTPEELAAERAAHDRVLLLSGQVVDAKTGKPIAGARLLAEMHHEPCPRIPADIAGPIGGHGPPRLRAPVAPGNSDKAGQFRWMTSRQALGLLSRFDAFVSAPGYVTSVLCLPAPGSEVTVKLAKAIALTVDVTDPHQRPIEGATLLVRPAEGTLPLPGHAGVGMCNEEGTGIVDGLLPGPVMLVVDHPAWMPSTVGPFDPAGQSELTVALKPALRLIFEIRSDDGSDIKNPLLSWATDGATPQKGVLLLQVTPNGPESQPLAEVKSLPVRIPCDHRNVHFHLKADGFAAWRGEPEPLPGDGGERTVIASLTPDASLAPLDLEFTDADGQAVSFASLGAKLDPPIRLDGTPIGEIVLEGGQTLHFPGLIPGPYRFVIRMPKHAPVEVDVDVLGGQKNEKTVELKEPAKLHLKFTAAERLLVRFRIVQNGRTVKAFSEKEGADSAQGLSAQGNEGTVFSGLGEGTYRVEVTSPELRPVSRDVTLHPGETTELEIEVEKR